MKFKNRADAATARAKAVADARAIATKAENENRGLSSTESARVHELVGEAKAADVAVKGFDGDQALRDELSILGRPGGGRKAGAGRPTDGRWAKAMNDYLGRIGAKALVPSGTITVPSLSSGIVANQDRPRSILAMIPFVPLEETDSFAYLRETVRDHNASTVRPGQVKPRSVYSLEKIEDRARTIAHLTEPIDRSTLMDVALLQDYLEGALRDGVMLELEDQVLNGDGSTAGILDNLEGILETSGIQGQAWDTNRLVTARKAVTTLENENLDTGGFAWAMNPSEWEAFELLTDEAHFVLGDPGTAGQNPPIDRARRTLWGYKVVTTTAMVDGTALLGDFGGSVTIREREGVTITWSDAVTISGATAFERNQVLFRGEGRWGAEVSRPSAFVEVDLVPSGS